MPSLERVLVVPRRLLAAGIALALLVLGLAVVLSPPRAQAAPVVVAHGGAKQVWSTGLPAHASMTLVDKHGHRVATQKSDAQGGILFRNVTPGAGYRLREVGNGSTSARVTVHSDAPTPWDPGVYNQKLNPNGYGYLTTRDGTKLAYTVHPPTSPADLGGVPAGVAFPNLNLDYTPPYPTLIEYSGYGTAIPKGPENGIATLANLMGFAVVDVSMRGTGCSGGAFDFFEQMQNLDGYDAIETIARQPWVKGHRVGMMGISYGAISQLFTAQTNPPHLAAIAPLSTIDSVATTLFPGGILNTGFALEWAKERVHDALPASATGGQPWAYQRIQGGDTVCKSNQDMHGQAVDLLAKVKANSHYMPASADPLDPITFVHKIKSPVFLACQFQDEQTGGHCPMLVKHFTGTKKKWFTFTNGAHVDSTDPATFNRWYDFLELYVAHQAPAINAAVMKATAPLIYQTALGVPTSDLMTLPNDPIQGKGTYKAALAAFEKLPRVRVLFDNGAGKTPGANAASSPGNPYAGYAHSFSTFPVPGTAAKSWYLGTRGRLNAKAGGVSAYDRFTATPHSGPDANYLGANGTGTGTGGLWGNSSQWTWNWRSRTPGTAVSYLTAPLKTDTTVLGAGAVYAWVRSSNPTADVMATVTEVRPDGKENYVQSGYLRLNERGLATKSNSLMKQPSTLLQPILSLRQADVKPMPKNRFVKLAIPLYYEGHAYRAGSRIRITISAVDGDQPIWAFQYAQGAGTRIAIGHSKQMPSRLVLPVIPGLSVPTALPACTSLRNMPCRTYVALHNIEATARLF